MSGESLCGPKNGRVNLYLEGRRYNNKIRKIKDLSRFATELDQKIKRFGIAHPKWK
jgi:hypothetical protein